MSAAAPACAPSARAASNGSMMAVRGSAPSSDRACPRVARALLRVLLGALVAGAVWSALPELRGALTARSRADIRMLAAAQLCQAAALAALALSLRAALRLLHGDASYRQALAATVGAFALSRLLPAGGAAGGIWATRRLADAGNHGGVAGAAVALSAFLTMAVLGAIVAAGALAAAGAGQAPSGVVWPALALAAVVAASLAAGIAVARSAALRDRARRWSQRLGERGRAVAGWIEPLAGIGEEPQALRALAAVAGWASVSWGLQLGALWLVFAAIGAPPPLGVLVIGFGAANLAAALPHTPGGVGVVETGMTAAYASLGIPVASALLGVMCYRLIAHWLPVAAAAPLLASARSRRVHGRRS